MELDHELRLWPAQVEKEQEDSGTRVEAALSDRKIARDRTVNWDNFDLM